MCRVYWIVTLCKRGAAAARTRRAARTADVRVRRARTTESRFPENRKFYITFLAESQTNTHWNFNLWFQILNVVHFGFQRCLPKRVTVWLTRWYVPRDDMKRKRVDVGEAARAAVGDTRRARPPRAPARPASWRRTGTECPLPGGSGCCAGSFERWRACRPEDSRIRLS